MTRRGGGGLLTVFCVFLALAHTGSSAELFINGQQMNLSESPVFEGDSVLVPFVECALHLGLAVDSPANENVFVLRGDDLQVAFDTALFASVDGVAFASLDWLVAWAEGRIHRIADAVHVETDRSLLTSLEAASGMLTARFDRFAPHEVDWISSSRVILRAFHSELDVDPRRIVLGEADIRSVQISSNASTVELLVTVEPGTQLSIVDSESDDVYSLTLHVSEAWSTRTSLEVDEGVRVVEYDDERVSASYVYVETWRERFRLAPAISQAAYGAWNTIESLLRNSGGRAAMGFSCKNLLEDPELLLIDGIPYAAPEYPSRFLAMDLFGRWSVREAVCTVNLKHAGLRIPVDAVNRPLGYGEVVLYAPGYQGHIARGVPGSFLAIKLRENRVVSVYEGPFVPSDPTAVMIVASGDAKARLSLIHLSDALAIECLFGADETQSCVHALACGPELLRDGIWVAEDTARPQLANATGGALLVSDWQGGMYLMDWQQHVDADEDASDALYDFLLSLPTAIKDAVLLEVCPSGSIAYTGSAGVFRLGAPDPVCLSLCLVPLSP